MSRYPTDIRGLAIPVAELGYTPVSHERGKTTNHHLQFERRLYQDERYKRVFRNLVDNVEPMLRREHDHLHDRYSAPRMPSDSVMIDVVEEHLAIHGVITCVREKRTNETYEIHANDWQFIKGFYIKAA